MLHFCTVILLGLHRFVALHNQSKLLACLKTSILILIIFVEIWIYIKLVSKIFTFQQDSIVFVKSKIETIGDAYVCAGGLHQECKYHAHRISWMGLLMIESASKKCTHKGDYIQVGFFQDNIQRLTVFFMFLIKRCESVFIVVKY